MALSKASLIIRGGNRVSSYRINCRDFSSKWESLVGEPQKSPFGNDRRILKSDQESRAVSLHDVIAITSSLTQKKPFSTSKLAKTNKPTVPEVNEKTKCDLTSLKAEEIDAPQAPSSETRTTGMYTETYVWKSLLSTCSVLVVVIVGYVVYIFWKNNWDLKKSWGDIMITPQWMITAIKEPSREVLLPHPLPAPYIQPKYTLVLELKDVLVRNTWDFAHGHRYMKRPGVDQFLEVVGYPNFEVVIYSDESPLQDAMIFPMLDPHGRIMYRLYRDCTEWKSNGMMNGKHFKVLEKLNRDLSKVIFVDTEPRSTQPANQLLIPKWNGDMNDTGLIELAGMLSAMYMSDVEDVRTVIEHYNSQDVDMITAWRHKVNELEEQSDRDRQTRQHKSTLSPHLGKAGFSRILI